MKIKTWALAILDGAAASLLLGLLFLTAIDVGARYLFNRPITGANELTEYGLAILVFISIPLITYARRHIVVDILDSVTPPWLMRIQEIVSGILGSVVFVGLAWRLNVLAGRAQGYGEASPQLSIPLAPVLYTLMGLAVVAALAFLVTAVEAAMSRKVEHHSGDIV